MDHLTRFRNRNLLAALDDAEALAAAYEVRLRAAGRLDRTGKAVVPEQLW